MLSSADDLLQTQLDPGERLLWAGQPLSGVRLREQDVFLIPISLIIGVFSFFFFLEFRAMSARVKAHAPDGMVFMLFDLPNFGMVLYLIFGRFLVDAWSRARTFYGVTNERVLIVSQFFSQQVKSLPLRTLTDVSRTQHRDGTGTITFSPTHPLSQLLAGVFWHGAARYAPPAFDLIENAKEVYDVIRSAQRGAAVG